MAKKTQRELDYELRARKVDRFAGVAQTAIMVAGFVAAAWLVAGALETLSGKSTFADVGVRFIADLKISTAVAWLFGAGGIGYGVRSRQLLQRAVAQHSTRIKELEGRIDSKRSSSHLPPSGTTNPQDKKI